MISRDLTSLRAALDSPDTSSMLSKTQRQSALKLLEDSMVIHTKLSNALQTGKIISDFSDKTGVLEEIENCIAEAAYLNIVDETLSHAVDVVAEISSDAKVLLSRILESLRSGSKDQLDDSLLEAHRVGWDHSYVHDIAMAIFEERNRLIQEEIIKQKLFEMVNNIKGGQQIKGIEIMQILRTIKSLHLDQNTCECLSFLR